MYSKDDQGGVLCSSSSIRSRNEIDSARSSDSSTNKKARIVSSKTWDSDIRGELQLLASELTQALEEPITDDTLELCGIAPLQIISSRPEDVLTLAYDKLSTWPFHEVPTCWRRLYEDASLYKAISILRSGAVVDISDPGPDGQKPVLIANLIDLIISELDKGLTISGAPGRQDVFEFAFQYLDSLISANDDNEVPQEFSIRCPETLKDTKKAIPRVQEAYSFDKFQEHVSNKTTPLIIPDTLDHWPATELWQNPNHLMKSTLGGRRLVPVEIGRSYTDEGWSQRVMPFKEFLHTYILPESPPEIGYLAQHDLFAQIPDLRKDIAVPDYCFTAPGAASQAAQKTAGLSDAKKLDAPLLNAWFGPKGTKTPLHTDSYHNILCQVVGHKYVRLYAPEETAKVYPRGRDEKGISMENTSGIDVSFVRPRTSGGVIDEDRIRQIEEEFPLFGQAKYQEAILGPGECLYIPLGWWHYVESESTSFSVSFWWN